MSIVCMSYDGSVRDQSERCHKHRDLYLVRSIVWGVTWNQPKQLFPLSVLRSRAGPESTSLNFPSDRSSAITCFVLNTGTSTGKNRASCPTGRSKYHPRSAPCITVRLSSRDSKRIGLRMNELRYSGLGITSPGLIGRLSDSRCLRFPNRYFLMGLLNWCVSTVSGFRAPKVRGSIYVQFISQLTRRWWSGPPRATDWLSSPARLAHISRNRFAYWSRNISFAPFPAGLDSPRHQGIMLEVY